ncbi:MAG TPA: hypothetical protein VGE77_08825 [Nocardioides sp.]
MNQRRTRRTAFPALALASVLTLAACSGDDESTSAAGATPVPGAGADDSAAAAERFAALPVTSIEATILDDMAGVSTIQARVRATHLGLDVDAQVAVDDSADCVGTVAIGEGTAEILRVGEQVYATFDQPFLEAMGHGPIEAGEITSSAANRWVLLDLASGLTDVALACQAAVEAIGGEIFGGADADTQVTGLEQVGDRQVLGLERTSELGTTSLLVDATGEHRFVRIVAPRDGSPMTVDELVYDEVVEVPDPDARGVVLSADVGLS